MRRVLYLALATLAALGTTAVADAKPDPKSEPPEQAVLDRSRATAETPLAPGATYRLIALPDYALRVHVWAFDPARYRFRMARQNAATGSLAGDFLARPDDVFAIDGGFFEKDSDGRLSPSGLLVIDGTMLAPAQDRAGSGVVYSRGGVPAIAYRAAAPSPSWVRQAVQVGPILVDPGGNVGIVKDQHDRLNRSALCLRPGSFVFVAVEGGLSLYRFARLLAAPVANGGLGCDAAINLDGGPSTQALYRADRALISVTGGWPVHNALVVSRIGE